MNANDLLTVNITGLKCDSPTCDYKNMDIKVEEYKEYIGSPCPECGASLLTQEDYDSIVDITAIIGSLNNNIKENMIFDSETDNIAKVELEFNGTGNVIIGDIQLIEDNELIDIDKIKENHGK